MPPHHHSQYYAQARMATPRYSAADSWGMGVSSVSAARLPVPAASSAAPLVSASSSSTLASPAPYYAGASASSGPGAGPKFSSPSLSNSNLVADLAAWPSTSSLGDSYYSASPTPSSLSGSRTGLASMSYASAAASMDDHFIDPALQLAVLADPFSAFEDAVFCPLPLSTIAQDHGLAEDQMKRLALAMSSPDLSAVAYLGPPRTPSPHSSRSSSRGSLTSSSADAAARSRAWSSSSSEADHLMQSRSSSSPTPAAPVARRAAAAIKIVDPSTRQAIDLRSAVRPRRN
ncbi:hypothetical protein BCR44DRAFT_1115571 [Catenaria anguillulae PL171]|uniref:Uncharacterized protein n=1 Tax=Catenaria anguillulae PL171 TaxID=765915 RepID=A0A1Y2HM17_9FUNG|nr:hypothetical protein BCR44DRAFT_1115571 [Catenaria anguillulae PL171]